MLGGLFTVVAVASHPEAVNHIITVEKRISSLEINS
jgi:hypothetical protein